MSADDLSEPECSICLEKLDSDRTFPQCRCGYQMCRVCWINENQNGRCPACRQTYKSPENYKFNPPEEIPRAAIVKKINKPEKKFLDANARKQLSNVRVIQRNLVYITNLALSAAKEETLRKPEYFGKFGKIVKTIVNRSNIYSGPQGPSVSAYVTYQQNRDAYTAIKATDGTIKDGRLLRASFGTTKYCSYFLRNTRCPNPDCMYLHDLGRDIDSFTKEDMTQGKHLLVNMTNVTPDGDLIVPALKHEDASGPETPPVKHKAWNTVVLRPPAVLEPASPPQALNPSEWPDAGLAQTKSKRKLKMPARLSPTNHWNSSHEPSPISSDFSTSAEQSVDEDHFHEHMMMSPPRLGTKPRGIPGPKQTDSSSMIKPKSVAPSPQTSGSASYSLSPLSCPPGGRIPKEIPEDDSDCIPNTSNSDESPSGSPSEEPFLNLFRTYRENPVVELEEWIQVFKFDELVDCSEFNDQKNRPWPSFQPFGCRARSRFGFAQGSDPSDHQNTSEQTNITQPVLIQTKSDTKQKYTEVS